MLPWGHLAAGYFLYAALVRYRRGEGAVPAGLPVVALVLGTQFADLLDKPLAWYLGVLESGRSLGHSLLVAVVVIAVVYWVARRYERPEVGTAFVVGHLSHIAADALYPLLRGEWVELQFVLWPVLSRPAETGRTFSEVILDSTFSPTGYFEAALFVLAIALWVYQGAPGQRELHAGTTRALGGTATVLRRFTP